MTRVFGKRSYEKGVVIVRVEQKVAPVLLTTLWRARLHARTHSPAETRHKFARAHMQDGCKRSDGADHCLHLIADNLGWFEDNPVNVEM